MKNLSPTLWRTCRVLSGRTRLKLLQLVLKSKEWPVTQLADMAGIGEARASQELRRLQSRGLIKAVRTGRYLRYQPIPDPQVSSAKPLLMAMKAVLTRPLAKTEEQTIRVAKAFSHPRRLHIVRLLLDESCSVWKLRSLTGIPGLALFRHLRALEEGGVVKCRKRVWELAPNPHPLAICMLSLLGAKRRDEFG